MKIEQIIEELCNHEISKKDAIDEIRSITDNLRRKGALEFKVEEVYGNGEYYHGYLKLVLPYKYENMKHISAGDKVDVVLLP